MQPYPAPVSTAITNTAMWLNAHEDWVIRGHVVSYTDQLKLIVDRAFDTKDQRIAAKTRRDILYVLAYMPPEVRLGFIFNMAERSPDALDALLVDDYDRRLEPVLYNTIATLGSFARHALLSDIFTEDRLRFAQDIVRSGRTMTGMRPGDEFNRQRSGKTSSEEQA